jgi:hypothetical protein
MEVVGIACSISPNAAFAVADEVSRPPYGDVPDPEICFEVLTYLESNLQHPLTKPVVALARLLVAGGQGAVSVEDSVRVLRQVEVFPGQYNALSVAYFAADDIDGIADAEHSRIRAAWSAP